jgi:error-prone DNA polymerase
MSRRGIEILAAADGFRSCGQTRRQASWDARAIRAAPDLPLFAHHDAPDAGAEPVPDLPVMPLREEVVDDYRTIRLSLKAHPVAFMRRAMAAKGYVRSDGLRGCRFNQPVRVAGLVLIRQKPGSAKGVCFVTLEDEAGVVNVVIWPDLFARYRKAIMSARLMAVRGHVQFDDAVIHVVAHEIEDRTDALDGLSGDAKMPEVYGRGDEGKHPAPPIAPRLPRRGHPRDAEVIPKSRDYR